MLQKINRRAAWHTARRIDCLGSRRWHIRKFFRGIGGRSIYERCRKREENLISD